MSFFKVCNFLGIKILYLYVQLHLGIRERLPLPVWAFIAKFKQTLIGLKNCGCSHLVAKTGNKFHVLLIDYTRLEENPLKRNSLTGDYFTDVSSWNAPVHNKKWHKHKAALFHLRAPPTHEVWDLHLRSASLDMIWYQEYCFLLFALTESLHFNGAFVAVTF